MPGKLYLIPTTLGDSDFKNVIPDYVMEVLNQITHFIVENERTARRYLIKVKIKHKIDDLSFYIINKHTKPNEISDYLLPLMDGENMGIISEAGVPAIADPGSEIVKLAHQKSIDIIPLVGPSSIILALMASGMNGQNFAFNGYLPIKSHLRIKKIKFFENRALREHQTQIFIEAPYRNHQLFNDFLTACNKNTKLCIAYDLTLPGEKITTLTIEQWKKVKPDFNKKPAIFLIYIEN
ncbi:MAG: SAM-dependent methyltransferase [Chlorobi bacterium]|nr:SAM-dependent methyltransferase [Chlorobiota bacterium]